MRLIPGGIGEASYFLTAVYAMLGRRQAVAALLLVALLNNLTHAFGDPPKLAALTRFFVLFAAAASVFLVHRRAINRRMFQPFLLGTLTVIALIGVHSMLFSTLPLLSSLKAASFGAALLTLLVACGGMQFQERRELEIQVLGIVASILIASIPLIFTSAGYYRGFDGLSGMIKHPQAFGVIASVAGVVFTINIFAQRRLSFLFVVMAAISISLTFLSKARVGGAVLVGGLGAGLTLPLLSSLFLRRRARPRVLWRRVVPATVLLAAVMLPFGPVVVAALRSFALKYYDKVSGVTAIDAMWESRGKLILPMLENIERRPYGGVGFGVPGEGDKGGLIVNDPFFGLPIMATTEKGFLPVAIIEELGIPLGVMVYAWLFWLISLAARGGVISFATCMGVLFVNVAESVLFAVGGLGMSLWVFISLALTSAAFNVQEKRQSLF
jgi:hypothetical protein